MPPRSLHVLHVDDDDINRTILQQLLVQQGHTASGVSCAEEALELLNGPTIFDVVLTDIHMPDMTGVEMLRELLAHSQAGALPPVLAVTADVLSLTPAEYQALGFAGVVAKPFTPENISGALTAAMSHSFYMSGFRRGAAA